MSKAEKPSHAARAFTCCSLNWLISQSSLDQIMGATNGNRSKPYLDGTNGNSCSWWIFIPPMGSIK